MDNEETIVLPPEAYAHFIELCERPPEFSPEVKARWQRARERLEALEIGCLEPEGAETPPTP